MERHITDTLTEIGKKMGFPELAVNSHGILHLLIANTGELFIDIQQPNLFLYLFNKFPILNFKLVSRAYVFCEEKAKYNFLTNPVMYDEVTLGFVIKIKENHFTSIAFENAINQLIDMTARLKQFADNF